MKTLVVLLALASTSAVAAPAGHTMRDTAGNIVYVAGPDVDHAHDLGYVDVTPEEAGNALTQRDESGWTNADTDKVIAFVAMGLVGIYAVTWIAKRKLR